MSWVYGVPPKYLTWYSNFVRENLNNSTKNNKKSATLGLEIRRALLALEISSTNFLESYNTGNNFTRFKWITGTG